MIKNNKGYFLAEALVVTSLVTLVILLIYPQITKRYETQKTKLSSYNRVEDIYKVRDIIYNIKNSNNESFFDSIDSATITNLDDESIKYFEIDNFLTQGQKTFYEVDSIYLLKYNVPAITTELSNNLLKYIKNIRVATKDSGDYRVIIVFNTVEKSYKTYATIRLSKNLFN